MAEINSVKLGQKVHVLPIFPDEPQYMVGVVTEIDAEYCDEECGRDLMVKLSNGDMIDACEKMVEILN